MTQIETASCIINCMEDAKKYSSELNYSKEMTAEIELLKLKHELYVLCNKIYKDIPFYNNSKTTL